MVGLLLCKKMGLFKTVTATHNFISKGKRKRQITPWPQYYENAQVRKKSHVLKSQERLRDTDVANTPSECLPSVCMLVNGLLVRHLSVQGIRASSASWTFLHKSKFHLFAIVENRGNLEIPLHMPKTNIFSKMDKIPKSG